MLVGAVLVDKAEQTTLSLEQPTQAVVVAVVAVMEMVVAVNEMVKQAALAL